MKTTLVSQIEPLANEFRQGLELLYGDQLAGLVLFGSCARGNVQPESDVDFAVVLKDPATRTTAELFRLAPLTGYNWFFNSGRLATTIWKRTFQ